MIHIAKQLKDKVKNMSGGNSEVAQALIRTYFMERFLERVSVSEYRNNFILKGGIRVGAEWSNDSLWKCIRTSCNPGL